MLAASIPAQAVAVKVISVARLRATGNSGLEAMRRHQQIGRLRSLAAGAVVLVLSWLVAVAPSMAQGGAASPVAGAQSGFSVSERELNDALRGLKKWWQRRGRGWQSYYLYGDDIPMTRAEVRNQLLSNKLMKSAANGFDACNGAVDLGGRPTPQIDECLAYREYATNESGRRFYIFDLREKEVMQLHALRPGVVEQSRIGPAPPPGGNATAIAPGPTRQLRSSIVNGIEHYRVLAACDGRENCADVIAVLRATSRVGQRMAARITVAVADGRRLFWGTRYRHIRYAIERRSFPNDATYEQARLALASAAETWSRTCPECKLTFEHLDRYDRSITWPAYVNLAKADEQGTGEGLRFIVQYARSTGFVAHAFFPDASRDRRVLTVFPPFFQNRTAERQRATMLHEIGHILGYRHEQIRRLSNGQSELELCAAEQRMQEGRDWRALTQYDPISIMHYVCKRGELPRLDLSAADIQGHRNLYVPQPPTLPPASPSVPDSVPAVSDVPVAVLQPPASTPPVQPPTPPPIPPAAETQPPAPAAVSTAASQTRQFKACHDSCLESHPHKDIACVRTCTCEAQCELVGDPQACASFCAK